MLVQSEGFSTVMEHKKFPSSLKVDEKLETLPNPDPDYRSRVNVNSQDTSSQASNLVGKKLPFLVQEGS